MEMEEATAVVEMVGEAVRVVEMAGEVTAAVEKGGVVTAEVGMVVGMVEEVRAVDLVAEVGWAAAAQAR